MMGCWVVRGGGGGAVRRGVTSHSVDNTWFLRRVRICHNINVRIAWEQIPHHHPLHRQGWKSCRHRRRKQSQGEGRLWPEEMSNDKRQKKITNDKRPMKIIYDKRPPQWQMTKGSPCVVSIYGHCPISFRQPFSPLCQTGTVEHFFHILSICFLTLLKWAKKWTNHWRAFWPP